MTRGTNNQDGKTSPKTSKSAAVSDQERVEATINDVKAGKSSSVTTGKTSGATMNDSGKISASNTGKSSGKTSTETDITSGNSGKTSAKTSENSSSGSKELSITEQAQYADEESSDGTVDNSGLVMELLDHADVLILKASECVRQAAKLSV